MEVAMANADRLVIETAHVRNELESYIYDMRDKVPSESHLGPYGTDAEKAAFTALNEKTENWLYEEGFDASKKVYAEKLAQLKTLGSPMEKRLAEAHGRPAAIQALQAHLEMYKNWVNNESQSNPAYAHITDDDRQIMHGKCDEISAWMYDMLDKQGQLAPNQDALLTVAELARQDRVLVETCGPVMKKPVPPKKKEEEKKPDAPAAADAAKTEGAGGAAPMEGVETENGTATPAPDAKMDTE